MSPSSRSRRLIGSVGVIALTALLWFGLSRLTDAQGAQSGSQALDALASYTVDTGQDLTAAWLDRLGYQPAVPAPEWAQYPAHRKLAMAYLAAQHADPARGGDRFLAALSQDLARRYDSVRGTPNLEPYLSSPPPGRVTFTNPPAVPATIDLPPRVSQAIGTLAEYSASGPLGTPRTILTTHFGVAAGDVDRLLIDSRSNHEAFRRAATRLDAAGQQRAISSWASAAASRYDAVWHEPSLSSYLPPRDGIPSPAAAPPRPRPAVPSGTTAAGGAPAGAAPRFDRVMRSAPGSSFARVSRSIRGPGGVLFGNDVSSSADLVPVSLAYEPGAAATSGAIAVTLSDGSIVRHAPVSALTAFVAHRFLLEPTLQPGAAIGLAGIESRAPYLACDSTTYRVTTGTRFNVALSPALIGTDLGWSAVMVDALPVRTEQLFSIGRQNGPETEVALRNLFRIPLPPGFTSLGTWKIVDVPITLSRDGGRLIAERTPEPGAAWPVGLRRSAFLEMRRFVRDPNAPAVPPDEIRAEEYDRTFAARFYGLMPILTQASTDYAQVNELARVLAVVRWAAFKRARFIPPPAPRAVTTPDAILLTDTTTIAVREYDQDEAYDRTENRLFQCMDDVEAAHPSVGDFADRVFSATESELLRLEVAARATPATRFWWRLFTYLVEWF